MEAYIWDRLVAVVAHFLDPHLSDAQVLQVHKEALAIQNLLIAIDTAHESDVAVSREVLERRRRAERAEQRRFEQMLDGHSQRASLTT